MTDTERGIVLAAVLSGDTAPGNDRQRCLQRLADPLRQRCSDALEQLAVLDSESRRRAVRQMTQRVLSPLPAGIELIHPSWIAAALADQPAPLLRLALDLLPPIIAQPLTDNMLRSDRDRGADPSAAAATVAASAQTAARTDRPRSALLWRLCQQALGSLQPMDEAARASEAARAVLGWPLERLERALAHLGSQVAADGHVTPPGEAGKPSPGAKRAERRHVILAARYLAARAVDPQLARALAQRLPLEVGRSLIETADAQTAQTAQNDTEDDPLEALLAADLERAGGHV